MDVVTCHRCQQPGHGYEDCDLPPAKDHQQLQQRIQAIIQRWDAGHGMTTALKSQLIEIENRAYKRAA